MSNFKLYTDGGARGNPGPAGAGVVLKNPSDQTILELHKYLGEATNNEAEYLALQMGLEVAVKNNIKTLTCILDSELVVKQLKGDYKVKNGRLHVLFSKIKNLEKEFASVAYIHVKRAQNKRADQLVNQALDDFMNNKGVKGANGN